MGARLGCTSSPSFVKYPGCHERPHGFLGAMDDPSLIPKMPRGTRTRVGVGGATMLRDFGERGFPLTRSVDPGVAIDSFSAAQNVVKTRPSCSLECRRGGSFIQRRAAQKRVTFQLSGQAVTGGRHRSSSTSMHIYSACSSCSL